MKSYITLANGRRVSLSHYVAAIRHAKAHPEAEFSTGLTGWWPVLGREVVAQFYGMVQDHCNRGLAVAREISMKRAWRRWADGVVSHCRGCGAEYVRHNPHNDNDRYCSAGCRA